MKTVIFIQARMESTRLRGKVLYEIKNKTLLDIMYSRLLQCKQINDIVLCIPVNSTSDILANFCTKNDINFYRGSEDNVLDRFYQANKLVNADTIIRCTADCPLIDPNIVDDLVLFYENHNYDFVGFFSNIKGYPTGFDIEIFSNKMLQDSWNNQGFKNTKEHVTTYMRECGKYKIYNFRDVIPIDFKNLDPTKIHLSVDTINDFNLVKNVYENLSFKFFTLQDVIEYLTNNPELLKKIKDEKI